jgi:DNA-binding CsgD family transcriptional regulator
MSRKEELIEEYRQLTEASEQKAAELIRATGTPGGNRQAVRELLDLVHGAEIPTEQKRPISTMLLELVELESLEERMGTVLTRADVVFLKALQAKHPGLNPREYMICLFVKLGYGTADVARRVGISTRGMESIRYRLHKKIGREKHEAIKTYLGGM